MQDGLIFTKENQLSFNMLLMDLSAERKVCGSKQ